MQKVCDEFCWRDSCVPLTLKQSILDSDWLVHFWPCYTEIFFFPSFFKIPGSHQGTKRWPWWGPGRRQLCAEGRCGQAAMIWQWQSTYFSLIYLMSFGPHVLHPACHSSLEDLHMGLSLPFALWMRGVHTRMPLTAALEPHWKSQLQSLSQPAICNSECRFCVVDRH